jgi:hypothetical protein
MVLANSSNLSKTYQPERATMSTESFVDFLRNDFPCSLEDIPGIPASAVAKLYKHQIFTAFQLFGKFLSFKRTRRRNAQNKHLCSVNGLQTCRLTMYVSIRLQDALPTRQT